MPRAKKSISNIPAADLAYAVNRLIALRRIAAADVEKLAAERPERIATLERELAALRAGGAVVAPPRRGPGPRRAAPKKKRKFTMTPKARAARKLQGRYLGVLRKIQGAARAKVKAIAKKNGVAAAVKAAEGLRK